MNAQEQFSEATQAVTSAKKALEAAVDANAESPSPTNKGKVTKAKKALQEAETALGKIDPPEAKVETKPAEPFKAEEPKPKKILKALHTRDFGQAMHRVREFDAMVPMGTTKEDLTNPALWVHVARQVSIGNEIRVVPEDCSYYAKLFVVDAQGSQLKVRVIQFTVMESPEEFDVADGPFTVKHKGMLKWCIVDTKTSDVVANRTGYATQAEAARDMTDLMRALNN